MFGSIKATLTFGESDTGSIRLSKKHTIQRGGFILQGTTPELFHFTGDESDGDEGELVFFGTNGNDTITASVTSNGVLQLNRNGTTKLIAAQLVDELAIITADGADKVTISPEVERPGVNDFDDEDMPGVIVLAGAGNDTVVGGDGWDRILGGSGKDQLTGGAGNDTIDGGSHSDRIFGNDGDDNLKGNDGDDRIEGNAGADRITGGNHNDTILGGAQNDVIYGDAGDDSIDGGIHNDRITGGLGSDHLIGDAGSDTFFSNDGLADILNGGAGNDVSYADDKDSLALIEQLL